MSISSPQETIGLINLKWSQFIPSIVNGKKNEPHPKQIAFLALPHEEVLFGGAAGGGKLLAKGNVVLTPFGWKKCEDLKVGDRINNPDGSITRIVQLKAWERLPKWTVYFDDGTSTEVAEEHLWLAWRSGKGKKLQSNRLFSENAAEVITTRELQVWSEEAKAQQQAGKRPNWPLIPVCSPQRFNVSYRFPASIDPYLLGVLIGDGCITSKTLTISCSTQDYQEHWGQELHIEHKFSARNSQPTSGSIRIVGSDRSYLVGQLTKLNLLGKNSHTKFIPRQFLYSSIESRIALLQGLMDTDGFVDTRGQLYYCSVSPQLREDFCFLIRSLGGVAKQFDDYEIYISLPFSIQPCRLQRKIDRCRERKAPTKRVLSVIKSGTVLGRCLTISHPNGLYITNDFIVTHNSSALLMGALQYADDPSYKGILFRRALTDHDLPGSIMNRAKEWLAPFFDAKLCKWGKNFTIHFKNGGQLTFGYLDKEGSRGKQRYQSSNYHYIGFDELTHFTADEYIYLFSRLRRDKGDEHLPLRMRAGTNPGGPGMAWVKERFGIESFIDSQGKKQWRGTSLERPFIQSKVADNPGLDAKSYNRQLDKQRPEIREQLKEGDWDIIAGVIHHHEWYTRRWHEERGHYILDAKDGTPAIPIDKQQVFKFFCIDSAVSESEGVEGRSFKPGQEPSWHVCGLFGLVAQRNPSTLPTWDLLWLDNLRGHWSWPEFIRRILQFNKIHQPAFARVEDNSIGGATLQQLHSRGMQVYPVRSAQDKLVRNIYAQTDAEAGKIWLPDPTLAMAPWLPALEGELFSWTGRKTDLSDQIDVLSSASEFRSQKAHGYEMEPIPFPPDSVGQEGSDRILDSGRASGGVIAGQPPTRRSVGPLSPPRPSSPIFRRAKSRLWQPMR